MKYNMRILSHWHPHLKNKNQVVVFDGHIVSVCLPLKT